MTRTERHQPAKSSDTDPVPRLFGKAGYADTNPNAIKKNGFGKGNWGRQGDEVQDLESEFNFTRQRRRSNSSSAQNVSKFEVDDLPIHA